jgi:hypothetical protein
VITTETQAVGAASPFVTVGVDHAGGQSLTP